MSQGLENTTQPFIDRRLSHAAAALPDVERRQFSNSYEDLSPSVRELALAIDEYKLHHRRRFITYQEMLDVVEALGYHK
jgi:hypothetical protein